MRGKLVYFYKIEFFCFLLLICGFDCVKLKQIYFPQFFSKPMLTFSTHSGMGAGSSLSVSYWTWELGLANLDAWTERFFPLVAA